MYLTALCKPWLRKRQVFFAQSMRVSRLTFFLVLLSYTQVHARAFSQNITFSGKNVSLQAVFTAINKQAGYVVFCDYSLIKDAGKVTVSVKDAPFEAVLNEVLKNQPLTYEVIGKTIVISRKNSGESDELAAMPPPIDVHGKVVNEKGEPVVAATVAVKGSSKVVATDDKGEFHLNGVDKNAVLVITSVGFERLEVKVAGQSELSVTLKFGASLGELVVTALGISKEARKIGYSVDVVNSDQMTKARETNVALSLEGQVAGLDVHGTNGGPGGTARILLRGMSSMNDGGSPLFVINGVPIDNTNRGSAGEWGGSDNGDGIGNINPDDIETMTVLKGQAASALYGSRATNGVIMITTKTAKKGDVNIEYNVNAQWDKLIDYTDFQKSYGQGLEGAKPTTASGALNTNRLSWGSKLDGLPTIQFDGNTYAYSEHTYKQNADNFYRVGPSLTNTVSVSSGTDRGNYRLSVSNLDNSAIVRNSGIDRKSVDLNMSQKVTDRLTVNLLANYIDQQNRNQASLSDGPGNPNNFLNLATNVDDRIFKPGWNATTGMETQFSDDPYVTNPWFVVANWINNLSRKRLITSLSAKYNFTPWLYLMGRLGYDLQEDRIFNVTPTGTLYSYNSAGQSGQFNGLSNQTTYELNQDVLLGVSHKITSDLTLDATLGLNFRKNYYEYQQIYGGQFVIPYLYTPSNVVTFGRNYNYALTEVHSAFYTLDFSYKDFLILNTTGRYDAYSTLPSSNNSVFTPSVSGSFIFSKFVDAPWMNYGKFRLAYAQTSGQPFGGPNNSGAYQDAQYYGVGNPINGLPTGNYSSSLPNLFLKPFILDEVEVGAEMKFLDNRLGIDADYFARKTRHEILSTSISLATGYSSALSGTGSTQNRGFELKLTGTPIKTRDVTWDITLNLTSVKNKILETDAAGDNFQTGTYRPLNAITAFVKGLPGPQIMGYDYVRDAKGNIEVDNSGLPLVSSSQSVAGGVMPTLYGGLRNELTYKHWNLSFLISYNYGNKILSATSYYSTWRGLNKNTLVGRENGITTGVNATTDATNTVTATAQDYYQRLAGISKINVLDGDYIKLKQLTLGYTFNERMLGNIPVFRAVTVSLVGRNLLTLMKRSPNIDPEAQFAASVNYAGIEGTSLPSTRTYGINANFKFKK